MIAGAKLGPSDAELEALLIATRKERAIEEEIRTLQHALSTAKEKLRRVRIENRRCKTFIRGECEGTCTVRDQAAHACSLE